MIDEFDFDDHSIPDAIKRRKKARAKIEEKYPVPAKSKPPGSFGAHRGPGSPEDRRRASDEYNASLRQEVQLVNKTRRVTKR